MTELYLRVFIYILFTARLGFLILFLATKLRPRRLDLEKRTAYECGFEPFGEARRPFDISFYLIGILFLVFDLEVAFLLPWILSGRITGYRGLFSFVLFLAILLLGFVFEWQKGALDWTSLKNILKVPVSFLLDFYSQLVFSLFLSPEKSEKKMSSKIFIKNKKRVRKDSFSSLSVNHTPHHAYHLVDPSPWPALTAFCLLFLAIGAVLFFHGYSGAGSLLIFAFCLITYVASVWWRDVVREGALSFHTSKVQNGLFLGIILFIVSEAVFFLGLLWAFMHVALMPTVALGIVWPPLGILPFNWTGLPLRNTFILLGSFFTANRAKHALDCSDVKKCGLFLALTIGLRLLFMNCQYIEYTSAAFTFSDTVFGSAFYLTTGFHGLHVLIGRIYLAVCYFLLPTLKSNKSLRFNLAILYWHFVDIVWRRLLLLLYVWGSALPTNNIEACKDPYCEVSILLSERLQSQVLSFFLS